MLQKRGCLHHNQTMLYVVFTFISWKSANNEYENEVKKGMEKESQSKANAKQNNKRK